MQEGTLGEVDKLGMRLSVEVNCVIRLSGYGKDIFICNHGVEFPIAKLKENSNWAWAKLEHDKATN